jgi:hypothetical protein
MFHPRFNNLLQNYPTINPSNMSKTSCMGLAQFLFNHIERNSREQIKACINSEQNGVELLIYLQRSYGSTNITDTSRAKNHLESTLWEPKDTIDMFNSRFTNGLQPTIQVKLYLTRLVSTMTHNHSFYVEVRSLFLKLEKHYDREEPIDCTITSITQDLQNLEVLELNNSSSYNESHHHPRYQHNHSQFRSTDRTNRSFKQTAAANMIAQSKKIKTSQVLELWPWSPPT